MKISRIIKTIFMADFVSGLIIAIKKIFLSKKTINYPFAIIPGPLWMIFKILFLFILISLVKAIVPRYRFDQLMRLGWKIFLPVSLLWVVLTASFLFFTNTLPILK